jgi:hypothetical protein
VGCEARKTPAEGDVFFLDFYLYRTYEELALPAAVTVVFTVKRAVSWRFVDVGPTALDTCV